ncbi:type IV secretory system conjugative DNA transfer family protein [Bacillus cereus group sp. BfR-BA-01026]|uniref:type IV secretory system conjugative DNA transfer family protein n=1 Tax=Bacillus cereus group sp. BfR-BA-01026 TaxID=3094872 RepID=UPI0029C1FD4D|nr:type IV secretory system conjugative DNA transfer family protein [Bacillus cereus group sp. BfR-BA-01026]MDX5917482.1 type IV secretory system conjugative DNA transfer family protein [Bacillus cereus group sp. BfR-BA-01026]
MTFESKLRVFIINIVLVFVVITSIHFTNNFHENFIKELVSFNFEHIFTFLLIFLVQIVPVGLLLYKYFSNRKNKLADSNLLSYKGLNKEQRNARNSVFYPKNNRYFEKDPSALYVSRNVQIKTKKSHEHILMLGPTGSGKSASFFLPNLINLDEVSLVVTDPKAELCRKSRAALEEKGYKVIHLNFNDPNNSAHYSLLANARHHDDVRKIADAVLANGEAGKGDEWKDLSKTILEAFLFDEYDVGEKNISRMIKTMTKLNMNNEIEVESFFQNSSERAQMAFAQYKKTAAAGGMISSIWGTIQGKTKVFEFDAVQEVGKQNDFTPGIFREQKTALFVSYPEDEAVYYSAFLASFYYQLFNQIKTHKSVDESYGAMTGLPVYFLMDEFTNIGKVPGIDVLLSTVRSKKMSLVLGIQSIDQLKKNYKDTFNIIVENCKTKIALGGMTGPTAKFYSELVGEEEYTNMSVSEGNKSLSTSTSTNKKAILSTDQLRRLKTFELVCVSDNLKPYKDDKKFYFYNNVEYFLYKHLPFSVETTEDIIRKYSSFLSKKKAKETVQERKSHIQQERQEINEERVMIRQEQVQKRALSKQEEIQKMIEQRRKRDLE